jgi:uncharacterized membrane protein YqjE
MRADAPGTGEHRQGRESFGSLLSRLATTSAGLVRDEIDLAKQEVREKIRSFRAGIISIAVAVLFAAVALFTLDAALVIAIGKVIGFDLSALVVGLATAIVAGIVGGLGMARIRRTKLKPEQTIRSLQEDKEFLKRTVRSGWS